MMEVILTIHRYECYPLILDKWYEIHFQNIFFIYYTKQHQKIMYTY